MQYYKIQNDTLSTIADSIRSQTSSTSKIPVVEMASMIKKINGVNFEVIGGLDEPVISSEESFISSEKPYEGKVTLWVITDQPILKYCFSRQEPLTDGLEAGFLWIQSADEGNFNFNLLKDNLIPFYLGALIKRWNGSSWDDMDCKIHCYGEWNSLKPAEPTNWQWYQTYAGTSATWTAPSSQWYRFHVIGKGGNGGKGGLGGGWVTFGNTWWGTEATGGGGGSGASGSYGRYSVFLNEGETVSITYDNTATVLTFNNGIGNIRCPAGTNGSNGQDPIINYHYTGTPTAWVEASGQAGGAGGTAAMSTTTIDGEVFLSQGAFGLKGANGSKIENYEQFHMPVSGAAGGSTANPPYPEEAMYMGGTSKAGAVGVAGKDGDYVATGAGTILGNPGSGGGSYDDPATNDDTPYGGDTSYQGAMTTKNGYNGGIGQPGGVVIEIAVS